MKDAIRTVDNVCTVIVESYDTSSSSTSSTAAATDSDSSDSGVYSVSIHIALIFDVGYRAFIKRHLLMESKVSRQHQAFQLVDFRRAVRHCTSCWSRQVKCNEGITV
jgi:hypothetical protein